MAVDDNIVFEKEEETDRVLSLSGDSIVYEENDRISIVLKDSPSCSTCNSVISRDESHKCDSCKNWLCDTCYGNTKYCDQSDDNICKECERTCRCGASVCKGCFIYCNWCQRHVCSKCIIACRTCEWYSYVCYQCASLCDLCGMKVCRCCWGTTCNTCKTHVRGIFCRGCRRSDKIHTICLKTEPTQSEPTQIEPIQVNDT